MAESVAAEAAIAAAEDKVIWEVTIICRVDGQLGQQLTSAKRSGL